MGGGDHVGVDRQVVVEKLGRTRIVGENAADLRGRQHDRIGADAGQPRFDLALPGEIKRRAVDRHHLAVFAREAPLQR